jgi:cell division protein FtsA
MGVAIGDSGVAMGICRVNDVGGLYPFSYHWVRYRHRWDGVPTVEELGEAVKRALELVRRDCWRPPRKIFLCLPSWNLKKRHLDYEMPITPPNSAIGEHHLDALLESINQVAVTGNDLVIDVVPQMFVLDGVKKMRSPLGMAAEKMRLHAQLVITDKGTVQSLLETLRRVGISVSDLVTPFVAAGRSVLTEDEREAGVVLVDIGEHATCCSYYYEGRMFDTHTIPLGGRMISRDIARALQTSCNRVERLAQRNRERLLLSAETAASAGCVHLAPFGGAAMTRYTLREIDNAIGFSIEQLLGGLIDALQIAQGRLDFATAGIVFVGENALALRGMVDVARRRIDMPIRMGTPLNIHSEVVNGIGSPAYARLLGMIQHCFDRRSECRAFLEEFYETPLYHVKQEIKRLARQYVLSLVQKHLG